MSEPSDISDMSDMEALFQRALVSEDEAYLNAEARLMESAREAPGSLGRLAPDDPVGRLLARVLESAEERAADVEEASRYLDEAERWFARTVVGVPRVDAVVENLTRQHGGRLAEVLALRLVRVPSAPEWRARTALAYIERHPTPTVTEAVVRFATTTQLPQHQAAVARTLAAIDDPAMGSKVAAERERLARSGRSLPPALASLAP